MERGRPNTKTQRCLLVCDHGPFVRDTLYTLKKPIWMLIREKRQCMLRLLPSFINLISNQCSPPPHYSAQLMEPNTPLSIPELLFGVGVYLGNHTLTSCIRVSRAWNVILLPLLWYNFDITGSEEKCPPMDFIKDNACHIRKLSLSGHFASKVNEVDCSFPLLSVLCLTMRDPVVDFSRSVHSSRDIPRV